MSKSSHPTTAVILFCVLVGCGYEDSLDKEGGENVSSDDSMLATTTKELISTGEYIWSQGNQATPLGSSADRVCYLTRMVGQFEGWGESVHAFERGGGWYLGGSSYQDDVAASARCSYIPNISYYTGEYYWHQSYKYPTYLGPSSNRVCFLTRVAGQFEGWGEWVHVYESGGSWYLGGGSFQDDVAASARCVYVNSYSGEYYWDQYQGYPTYMGPSTGNSCALTYVKGKFKGWGEHVRIFDSGGYWYLGGSSLQRDVTARARCF